MVLRYSDTLLTLGAAFAASAFGHLLGVGEWVALAFGLVVGMSLLLILKRPVAATAPSPGGGEAPDPARSSDRTLEALPFAVVVTDAGGRITLSNAAARRINDRLQTDAHYSASFRNPELVRAFSLALSDGESAVLDFTFMRDVTRNMRAHIAPARLPAEGGGDANSVICLLEDRTARVRAEAQRVDFVANASHELKTPLAAVRGFVETMQTTAKNDPDARHRFLDMTMAQINRMQRLVEDLMSLNRIELDEHMPPRDRLRLIPLAQDAAQALAPLAEAHETEVFVNPGPDGLAVAGDPGQLRQAIRNLIENAIRYGPRGGRVTVSEIVSDTRPQMTGLTVADQGAGIAREHLPRLTERFYRVASGKTGRDGGTGLGLAIVKHVAARHRGELMIESELGVGSRFTIWLPLAERTDDADAA